jgi:hypothetical protein
MEIIRVSILILFLLFSFTFFFGIEFLISNFLLLLLAFIAFELFSGFMHYYRAKKVFYSDTARNFTMNFIINEDGINQKTEQSNSNYLWNNIVKCYEHEEMFVLYTSNIKMMIFPKKVFTSKEDIIHFRTLINSNVTSRQKHQS